MTNPEIREVMSVMKNFVSRDANQIIGTAFDNDMGDELRVTVVATGLDDDTGRHTPEAGQGGLGSSIYGRGPQVFSQPAFGQAPAQQAVPQAPIQQTFGYGYTQPVREPQSAPPRSRSLHRRQMIRLCSSRRPCISRRRRISRSKVRLPPRPL